MSTNEHEANEERNYSYADQSTNNSSDALDADQLDATGAMPTAEHEPVVITSSDTNAQAMPIDSPLSGTQVEDVFADDAIVQAEPMAMYEPMPMGDTTAYADSTQHEAGETGTDEASEQSGVDAVPTNEGKHFAESVATSDQSVTEQSADIVDPANEADLSANASHQADAPAQVDAFATTPMPASAFWGEGEGMPQPPVEPQPSAQPQIPTQPQVDAQPQASAQPQGPSVRSELLNLPSLDEDSQKAADTSAADVTEVPPAPEPISSAPVAEGVAPAANKVGSTFDKGGTGRRVLVILGIIFGALLIVYLIGAIFFMSHFMPNTRVNGEEVSGMSVDDLAAHITERGASFQTHITGDGLDFPIAASDIDLKYDGAAYGAEAGSQIGPWKWPVRVWKSHDFTTSTGITFDERKVEDIVGAAVDGLNAHTQPPTNATMSFDESKQEFVTVPDALGTMVDRSHTIETVENGIRTLQNEIVLQEADLTQPVVRVDDERLATVIGEANKIVKASIPMHIAGRDAGAVDATLLKDWLGTNENAELTVDLEKVKAWAQGPLSDQFDSVGKERRYMRPDGKQVSVAGGDYGWNLDGEALANVIADNLRQLKVDPIDVPMKAQAAEWNPGGADWGKRYIDVDIADQTVRVYDENSQLVLESACVTGIPDHATDEGVYQIYEHSMNVTLVGFDYNGDGQPDYQTPVTYWMPFNGGQGLHDAYWRGAFGGDIYLYDGSHGCVNLPSDVAAQLFEWAHEGDVVVVHS